MHELLKRQLEEHFGSLEDVPESLRLLLDTVDQTYRQNDADRQRLERSLALTSEKLLATNAELRSVARMRAARIGAIGASPRRPRPARTAA